MAHIRYPTHDIAHALLTARTSIGAARLLGMSQGALMKRCFSKGYPELQAIYRQVVKMLPKRKRRRHLHSSV